VRDVVGYPLEEARALLEAEGYAVRVLTTAPPWAGRGVGRQRVVRQRAGARDLELVVAWEWYEPAPRAPEHP